MRVPIERCEADACAYNMHENCHAASVDIGKERAVCELFTRSVMFVVSPKFYSQISSCSMSGCTSNRLGSCVRNKVVINSIAGIGHCAGYIKR